MKSMLASIFCLFLITSCASNNNALNNTNFVSHDEYQTKILIGRWVGSPKSFGSHVEMQLDKDGTGLLTVYEHPNKKDLSGNSQFKWWIQNGQFYMKITGNLFGKEENKKPQIGTSANAEILELSDKRFVTIGKGDSIKTIFIRKQK